MSAIKDEGISIVVTMSITGHLTERMHVHYSTVAGSEQREAVRRAFGLIVPRIKVGSEVGIVKEGGS